MKFFRNSIGGSVGSAIMLWAFLFSLFNPTISYALSTGPGQPELEGFSPIGMDNMVDIKSGDFSYNLPLFTVPGPDGGYPINMSYQAQPSMESSASWVGLGWSLNPGTVNREVRGLPDDLAGQEVEKKLSQKPNQTIAFNISAEDIEALGLDMGKVLSSAGVKMGGNVNFIFNNYKGFDVQAGIGFSKLESDASDAAGTAKEDDPANDTTGAANSESSYADEVEKNKAQDEKESSLSTLKNEYKDYYKNLGVSTLGRNIFGTANVRTTQNSPYDHPRINFSSGLNIKGGLTVFGITADVQFDVFFSRQSILRNRELVPAYGYLYHHLNYAGLDGLTDFSRDNQAYLTPDISTIPIPNFTHDIFHVAAQGLSGQVRAHRGEVSMLTEPKSRSTSGDGGFGLEFNGGPAEVKAGGNPRASITTTVSGVWSSGMNDLIPYYLSFFAAKDALPTYEDHYFKFGGELTGSSNPNSIYTDESVGKFGLKTGFGGHNFEPVLKNSLSSKKVKNLHFTTGLRLKRERRAKSFFTLTEKQADLYTPFTRQVFDLQTSALTNVVRHTDDKKKKLIGEVHVTDEAGKRFIYGIPAKNHVTKEITFSIEREEDVTSMTGVPKVVSYNSRDNSTRNNKGQDEFYSSTKTPSHAHSFLLTEVLSEDYVDISEDGPTPDDIGDYVAFDYSIQKGFKTKSPLNGAHYLPGKFSNITDDKASLSYFEKDIYYLKSIKTKTHIAVFKLDMANPREDGVGVSGENDNSANGQDQFRLKKIDLYNLKDYEESTSPTPIKTVNFEYSYELCQGANSSGGGKLTLKKVWYTLGSERTKMSNSPYEFIYGYNPDYDAIAVDKWGSYQKNSDNDFQSNVLYPYTTQKNQAQADSSAGAWSLSEIRMPTGGRIQVDYEADDYAFVQDRRAQQMYPIAGFASSIDGDYSDDLSDNQLYMVVEVNESLPSDADVTNYFKGFDQTYFKAFVKLKDFELSDKPGVDSYFYNDDGEASDFVEGYFDLEPADAQVYVTANHPAPSNKIVVKVKKASSDQPVKKAAWLDLKFNRMDLIDDSKISLDNFGVLTSGMLNNLTAILGKIFGFSEGDPFFRKAEFRNWAQSLDNSRPIKSIVRLNASPKKIGGGHRVKEIRIIDEWEAMGGPSGSTFTYGQKYEYGDEVSGRSYGVAQWEPSTGGEENPFRLPEKYSTDALIFKDDFLSVELPLGESFYPSAQVVYSKVKVINLANEQVTTSGAGIKLHEFYTAKDYPLITRKTQVETVNTGTAESILTFLGGKSYFEPGFSQGFKIELNDMHGKPKKVSTYQANSDLQKDDPVQSKEYVYRTKGGYSSFKKNRLDNEARVFYGDGYSELGTLGVEQDVYFDLKETSSHSISGEIGANLSTNFSLLIPIPLPSAVPIIDYNYDLTRWVSMTKVVQKTALLEKVITTRDGAITEEEYLGFDHETGGPVLTSTTTPFEDKTYHYNQLAKWYYDDLGGQFQNIGMEVKGANLAKYENNLHSGDILMDGNGSKIWVVVDDVAGAINYYDKTGTAVTIAQDDSYTLVQSGYANRLNESAGFIQTIGNPVGDLKENFALFKNYNQLAYSSRRVNTPYYVQNCEDDSLYTLDISHDKILVDASNPCPVGANCENDSVYVLSINYTNSNFTCNNDVLDLIFPNNDHLNNALTLNLYYLGSNKVLGVAPDGRNHFGQIKGGNNPLIGVYDLRDCFDFCIGGVLNASFTAYSDTLRSFEDFTGSTTGIALNPYYFNKRGVFLPSQSFFFPTTRTQASSNGFHYTTNIAQDGEYERFGIMGKELSNKNWKLANKVEKVDHNGMVIEESNALEIPSCALFDYSRSLTIATAQNAKYSEISFDGFEDHWAIGGTYDQAKRDNHINFGTSVALTTESHTGSNGISISSSPAVANLNLESGKKYVAFVWHKVGSGGQMFANDGTTLWGAETLTPNIDGWELQKVVFTAGSGDQIQLTGSAAVFDDIKVQPFNSAMSCYVYDKLTHKLIAQLDENHFATLYNYDKDQILVQVKKETERGVKTIQATQRSNSQAALN